MDGKSLDIIKDKLGKLKELSPAVFTEYPPYNTGNDHFVYPDRFSRWRQKKKGKRAKVATARDFWVPAVNIKPANKCRVFSWLKVCCTNRKKRYMSF